MTIRLPSIFLAVALLTASLAQPLSAQRRTSKPEEMDFPTAIAAAEKAFADKDYATAIEHMAAATRAAQKFQRVAIYAAMPDVAGFTRQPPPSDESHNPARQGVLGVLAGDQGIEQEYREADEGDKRLTIRVLPTSLFGMMSITINNPTLMAAQKGQELVEYDGYKAILDTQNKDRVRLTILISEKSTIEGEGRNMTADELLDVLSQANVDHLAAAILPAKKNG